VVVRAPGIPCARTLGLDCLLSIDTIYVVYSRIILVRENLRKIQSLYGIMTGFSIGKFNPKSLWYICGIDSKQSSPKVRACSMLLPCALTTTTTASLPPLLILGNYQRKTRPAIACDSFTSRQYICINTNRAGALVSNGFRNTHLGS
jgi:hypothetical protein